MPSIPPEELPQFLVELSLASIKLTTRYLIEWRLHTMDRPGEADQTRRDEIDHESKTWFAPDETMKIKRAHRISLTPQTPSLLDVMRPISGDREFVFPGDRSPKSHTHQSTANMAIKRMGYKGKLVAHDLRSVASTALNAQGYDPDIIEAALAQVDKNQVRSAYIRTDYLERRRIVMAWWSNYIKDAATGNLSFGESE